MRMTNFWDWIESAEFYDKEYRYDMDRYHGDNPKVFAHLFPEGQNRIYIPFHVNGDDQSIKATQELTVVQLRNALQEILGKHNYQLDFRKGMAAPSNNTKRQQRIIPVLQNIAKQDQTVAAAVQKATNEYQKAQLRLNPGPNEFTIVISQDPHDIALMTYDRPWKMTSCMRLKDDKDPGGAKFHQVYDEVREGGLIAYLCEPDDKDIKKPYARVLLRRFSNQKAEIALCEEVVYGLNIPGFLQAVKEWLTQNQPKVFGKFTRKGSEWSDTFPAQKTIAPAHLDITKENQPKLLDMLETLDTDEFVQQAQSIIAARKQLEPEFVTHIIDMVNEKFQQEPEAAQHANRRAYNFYIPRAAQELNIPVEDIEYIIKAFPLHAITASITTQHPESRSVTQYLLPVLKQMTHDDNYSLQDLAVDMQKNPTLASDEFISSFPQDYLEELIHYIDDRKIQKTINKYI